MEGSLTTTPFPLANNKVFAVPRSTARSEERKLKKERMLTAILFPHPGGGTHYHAIQLPGQYLQRRSGRTRYRFSRLFEKFRRFNELCGSCRIAVGGWKWGGSSRV